MIFELSIDESWSDFLQLSKLENQEPGGGICYKMVQDVARWCKMVQDGEIWWNMVEYGGIWCKMVQDGAGWWSMVQDDDERCGAGATESTSGGISAIATSSAPSTRPQPDPPSLRKCPSCTRK